MAISSITWAFAQRIPANHKYVLIAFSHHANAKQEAWPSLARLVDVTGLDPKTIKAAIKALKVGGYITDTQKRQGKTKQVIVYRIGKEVQKRTCLSGPKMKPLSPIERGPKTDYGSSSKHRPQTAPIHEGEIAPRLRVVSGGAK